VKEVELQTDLEVPANIDEIIRSYHTQLQNPIKVSYIKKEETPKAKKSIIHHDRFSSTSSNKKNNLAGVLQHKKTFITAAPGATLQKKTVKKSVHKKGS